jgi:arylsulfatase A-like enzyme
MPRRNIVVLLCDQLRPDFLPMYGGDAIATPNLDRLASLGVVFDGAITQSTVCAPARASMMTGRHVSDHGVWTNDVPFREGLEYVAERMNGLGYRTGAFGKLHHFPADDAKGFQAVHQMEEGRLGQQEPYLHWLRERHPDVTSVWNAKDLTFSFPEEEYYEHWIADRAIDFMAAADDVPFLAWVSFQGPHGPFDPPPEVKGTCDASKLPPVLRREYDERIPETVRYRHCRETWGDNPDLIQARRIAYAEMIVCIDRQIGRILDALEAAGDFATTTFLFSADHGDMLQDFGLTAKGPFPYRGQLDIPLLVANHPCLATGTRSGQLAGNIDLPGTLLGIAGADRSIGVSRSLLDLAQPEPKQPRDVILSEFCDSIRTIQDQRWRYSYYPFENRSELYDRENDPDELRNLAGQSEFAEIELRMLRHLVDYAVVNKGPRVEAHDFGPRKQQGLLAKSPNGLYAWPVAFPLSAAERTKLRVAGLDADYNEFCRPLPILRAYGKPYWEEEE